jgi:sirohydrochlorin cobaltochelatase
MLIETFLERLSETENGAASMNCQFCAYRTPVVGREDWRGAPSGNLHSAHPHPHDHAQHRCRCERLFINF